MNLIKYPHDFLRKQLEPVTEFGLEVKTVGFQMKVAMVSLNGAGLAANQYGINKRIFVLEDGLLDHSIICNPMWTLPRKVRSYQYVDIEGCLSFPDLFIPVIRNRSIDLYYQSWDGKNHVKTVSGFAARVVQHEVEHLDGVLFIDHLPEEELAKYSL